MENIKKAIQTILAIIFIGALGFGVYYALRLLWLDAARNDAAREYKHLRSEVSETTEEPDNTEAVPASPNEKTVLPEYKKLLKNYPNFGGWLKIEGTLVNYPVMIAKEKDPEYYLDHSYTGKQTDYGCLFIPFYGSYDSDNIIIYGHNCARGDMFGTLNRYLKEDFFREHTFIHFDTPYEHRIYAVFAVMKISVNDSRFHFENYTDWGGTAGKSHFYIEESVRRSLFKPAVTPPDGSKLLTLVTCEYTIPNGDGRYVIVAKDVTDYSNNHERSQT